MKLIIVNGINAVLVESDAVAYEIEKTCNRIALAFGAKSPPEIKVIDMPPAVLGTGPAAIYQAFAATIQSFTNKMVAETK